MLQSLLALVAVTLVGGLIPLFAKRSDRLLHLLISLATGLFLGVVFLHMLPSLAELGGGHDAAHGEAHTDLLWLCVLVGVVGLWLLQNLVLGSSAASDAHRHKTLGWAAFLGLAVHALTAGLGLAVADATPELGSAVYISILLHKASEGFSLATVFRLAGLKRRTSLGLVGAFSLVTPVGVLLGRGLVDHAPESALGLLTALAAGTFLFVSLYDLLPEVFHHREDVWAKVLLLAGGVGLSSMLHEPDAFNWVGEFASQAGALVAESAPYLLVGFFLAGLIKVFLPARAVTQQLGRDNFRSVLLSTLYGMPLPLCSCSVIPTAISLRKSGASKGATSAFLISTPETGVDSISITYALFDPFLTFVRPFVAFVTAIVTGSGVNLMVRKRWDGDPPAAEAEVAAEDPSCCHADNATDSRAAPESEWQAQGSIGERVRRAVQYAFGPLLDDLTPSLIVGLLVSGLIATFVPPSVFTEHIPSGWPAMLLMLVIGTPMYICAVASTPVAAALVAKGLDPGAALVFLLVGPATNVTTLLVVLRFLGKRVLVLYLVTIAAVALVAGATVSALYRSWGTDLGAEVAEHLHGGPGLVPTLSGILLAVLLLRSAHRIGLGRKWFGRLGATTS